MIYVPIGSIVDGKYRVIRELGRNGNIVVAATDLEHAGTAAIPLVLGIATDATAVTRFMREVPHRSPP